MRRSTFNIICIFALFATISNLEAKEKDYSAPKKEVRYSGVMGVGKSCTNRHNTIDKPKVTHTRDGIDLDTPVRFKIKGQPFEIPLGYLRIWPNQEHLEKYETLDAQRPVNFEFWMPDLRHPELHPISYPRFDDCEPGRKRPGKDDYKVKAYLELPFIDYFCCYTRPHLRFRNNLGFVSKDNSRYIFDNKYGLLKYSLVNPSGMYVSNYAIEHPENLEAFFRCTGPGPNPLCQGSLYYRKEKLAFTVRFPNHKISDWQAIVSSTRELIERWHINDKSKE